MMTSKEKLQRIVSDPVLWIETFVSLADKSGKIVPFKLTPQQKYILKHKEKYNIILKSRQLGLTSVSIAYSLYLTHTRPNITCMIMSYSDNGVKEIFEKLRIQYNNLPDCVRLDTLIDNQGVIKFTNNSRIINCTCGNKDNARGSTLTYCLISEPAHMDDNKLKNQLVAIEQALVSDGSMILESTARGLNYYFDMWNKSVSGEMPLWKPFFFGWVQDKVMFAKEYKEFSKQYKRIYGAHLKEDELDEKEQALVRQGATMQQLEWRRLKITAKGSAIFAQEFPSNPLEAFISTGSNFFDAEKVMERFSGLYNIQPKKLPQNVDSIIKRYNPYLTVWKLPEKKKKYFFGVNVGEGLDADYSVICIFDENYYQVAEWRSNKIKPYEFTKLLFALGNFYNKGLMVIEKASAGHTVLDRMKNDYRYPNLYKYKSYDQKSGKSKRKIGWVTTPQSKSMMMDDLQEIFETGQCLINSSDLLTEMKLFQLTEDGKLKAASGHDDCVMACAMALQGVKSKQYYYQLGK